jgi:hypothetical protein
VTRRRAQLGGEQLALPLAVEDGPARLAAGVQGLVALSGALHNLLAIADGQAPAGPESLAEISRSLDVLASFDLGGRLGHVVRRFRAAPPGAAGWAELTTELAFAVSLYPGGPRP